MESKNSEFVLVCLSFDSRNSIASVVPIGLRIRRRTNVFCRSILSIKQVLFPRSGFQNVDSREHALVGNLAIQDDFAVTGAFEFFEDDLVHPAAGIDQRRRHNRKRSTFFDIPRRTKEPLRSLQGIRIHTTCQNLARRRHHSVVGSTKSCD